RRAEVLHPFNGDIGLIGVAPGREDSPSVAGLPESEGGVVRRGTAYSAVQVVLRRDPGKACGQGGRRRSLVLSSGERAALERCARRGTVAQQLGLRARFVLRSAAGLDNKTVAQEVGVWPGVVGKWRKRFVAKQLEGLLDEPRPGARRKITDDQVEQVVIRTL